MGYYFELAIEGIYHEYHSYPSPELRWNGELAICGADWWTSPRETMELPHIALWDVGSPEMTWRTLLPEYFSRKSDVMNPLAIAEENLAAMVAEEAELCEIKKS